MYYIDVLIRSIISHLGFGNLVLVNDFFAEAVSPE